MVALGIPGFEEAELLGTGGFGAVYRARELALNRIVAVKVLNAGDADEAQLKAFERECAAIGQLDWVPGIVTVFSTGRTAIGQPYLVMEHAPGGSLQQRLRDRGPIPEHEVIGIGAAVAQALHHAHAAGVLHRDVKPANVLISRTGAPLLADFGIARILGTQATTSSGSFMGTVSYSPPEVLRGDPATERSDVYALGSTLYALLTGRPPFITGSPSDSLVGVVNRVISGPEADLTPVPASDALKAVLARCLRRDPSERYGSTAELARALGSTEPGSSTATGMPGQLTWATGTLVISREHAAHGRGVQWPTATDYVAAIQGSRHPLSALTGFDDATVVPGPLGMPASATGQNAIVFELAHGDQPMALRCFTREQSDGRAHYRALGEHLRSVILPEVTPAVWIDDGLEVDGASWPAVLMPWVPGEPLNVAVEDRLEEPDALRALAERWKTLTSSMYGVGMAHGDLQCGNVLVDGEGFRLVDLDGAYVPGMSTPPSEFGHPHFQHRARSVSDWGVEMDGFSAVVVYLSLLALAAEPDLWRFNADENLVLTAADFAEPDRSAAFDALELVSAPDVARIARALRDAAREPRPPTMAWAIAVIRGTPHDAAGQGSPYDALLVDADLAETLHRDQIAARAGTTSVMPATPSFLDAEVAEETVLKRQLSPQHAPPARPLPKTTVIPTGPGTIRLFRNGNWWGGGENPHHAGRREAKLTRRRSVEAKASVGAAYGRRIDRSHPALFVIMIDQSLSMADAIGGTTTSKAQLVAQQVNRLLYELVLKSIKAPRQPPRPYFYVSVIGYSGPAFNPMVVSMLDVDGADARGVVSTTQLAASPKRLDDVDGVSMPVWVEPYANGGTPMCGAFDAAGRTVRDWLDSRPGGFPPVVLNITDGVSSDGSPVGWADRVKGLGDDDGGPLVFNLQLTSSYQTPLLFSAGGNLPDKYAEELFLLSSPLPHTMLAAARGLGIPVPDGGRGFSYNADARSLAHFMNVGTSVGRV